MATHKIVTGEAARHVTPQLDRLYGRKTRLTDKLKRLRKRQCTGEDMTVYIEETEAAIKRYQSELNKYIQKG